MLTHHTHDRLVVLGLWPGIGLLDEQRRLSLCPDLLRR